MATKTKTPGADGVDDSSIEDAARAVYLALPAAEQEEYLRLAAEPGVWLVMETAVDCHLCHRPIFEQLARLSIATFSHARPVDCGA